MKIQFQLRKDRENVVIRYATVEKQVLDAKNLRDAIEKKNKELHREIELLTGKIKGAAGEKTRICGILDEKVKSFDYLRFSPQTSLFHFLVSVP